MKLPTTAWYYAPSAVMCAVEHMEHSRCAEMSTPGRRWAVLLELVRVVPTGQR